MKLSFLALVETDLNGFRLRHAYVKMEWQKASLLAGQYWHPMFPAENFPGTVSFNTGAPFIPFSRNPQVRLVYMPGKISFTLVAYSQRDFTSSGPDGNSSKYIRNSGTPGMHLQVKIPAGGNLTAWAGVDYKTIRPEIKTSANIETNVRVGSLCSLCDTEAQDKAVEPVGDGSLRGECQ
ncbi:MAG: hypothetical protein MZV70_51265 [Desulfobacterales bacterium]|nr:hypothetical protein [Desulfobacterales bacterium]